MCEAVALESAFGFLILDSLPPSLSSSASPSIIYHFLLPSIVLFHYLSPLWVPACTNWTHECNYLAAAFYHAKQAGFCTENPIIAKLNELLPCSDLIDFQQFGCI